MGAYPLLNQAPTHVEVELGCDNISVRLNMDILGYLEQGNNKASYIFLITALFMWL
jgi:hypothetical protein